MVSSSSDGNHFCYKAPLGVYMIWYHTNLFVNVAQHDSEMQNAFIWKRRPDGLVTMSGKFSLNAVKKASWRNEIMGIFCATVGNVTCNVFWNIDIFHKSPTKKTI